MSSLQIKTKMEAYLDTNILYYSYSKKKFDIDISGQKTTSINVLEFLKNIEKVHTNKAKYHIPLTNSFIQYRMFIDIGKSLKKSKRTISKRLSDSVIFDFAGDFDSYVLYNNESVAQVINNKLNDLFYLSIASLEKSEHKDVRRKFDFLIDKDIQCDTINSNDIEFGYELLDRFTQKYTLKNDFRNCWNDILILSKSINEGGKLITTDKLLNRFASEIYEGEINQVGEILEIQFPIESEELSKFIKQDSKGYINRGWDYKIRKRK